MKRWAVAVALVACVVFGAVPVSGGNLRIKEVILVNGDNTDSTEQVTPWFSVKGASRVYVRTWSAKAAFHASTDADSTRSDSLTTFKVLLSDSICCTVTGPTGKTIMSAADSVMIDLAVTAADTASVLAAGKALPINKQLRGPSNGSGLITHIFPPKTPTTASGTIGPDNGGVFMKDYMRFRFQPLRRMTVSGFSSTQGKRVNGLKGLRMRAYVVYAND